MKIFAYFVTYNCADIIAFTLRHYEDFCDKIIVLDDFSDDGTREILKRHPLVQMEDWPYPGSGIAEDIFLQVAGETYRKYRGQCDWFMVLDPDEFVFSSPKSVMEVLLEQQRLGVDAIRAVGFNMVHDGMPKDNGRSQIYDVAPLGVFAPVYSKPVIFQPHVEIFWNRGKHTLDRWDTGVRLNSQASLKILHYHYLGKEYTAQRNARNYDRCGMKNNDKGPAWSCHADFTGEHSATWAEGLKDRAFNVLEEPIDKYHEHVKGANLL